MGKTSETILALKPVTFHYKSDSTDTPQFGLLAEDVAEANPNLIVCDKEGKPFSVRYDQVNAMLLNEFLKEHKKVEEQQSKTAKQEATIAELQSAVAQQQKNFTQQKKQIEALTAALQRVSARLELSKFAPRVVQHSE
jgi:trimeric autotransporter adhesin